MAKSKITKEKHLAIITIESDLKSALDVLTKDENESPFFKVGYATAAIERALKVIRGEFDYELKGKKAMSKISKIII